MAPRTNTRWYTTAGGLHVQAGVHSYQSVYDQGYESRSDQTGPGDCAPFTVQKWNWTGGRINKAYTSWYESSFYDYIAEVLYNHANFPHLDVSGLNIPSNVDAATSAAARTSPSKPYVDVPADLLELADITRLIKGWGDSLLSNGANVNLGLNFGVMPVVSDLYKLWDFSDQVDRRVKVIQKLQESGYRRTVDVNWWSTQATPTIVCQSTGRYIDRPFNVNTRVGMRCHVRWVPTPDLSSMTVPSSIRALARRAVLGSQITLSTLWEITPWSWLIDWCGNVGQYLSAQRNIVPARLDGVHIIKHTKTTYSSSQWGPDGSGLTMTPISFLRETKTRTPTFIAPVAHFPFLSESQMGIVASLAITRM